MCNMGKCVLWENVYYGKMCTMGKCVLWENVYYGKIQKFKN